MEPQIRFCTSADGTRIAYAIYGEDRGTPVVSVNGWLGSLELDWKLPHRRHFYESLAHGRRLVSFDRRGTGASQRKVDDLSLEAHLADLAAIVDHLGLERFDLAGWVDGSTVSVAYAARHPERVSRLVLHAPYPRGEDWAKPEAARSVVDLIRADWALAQRMIADLIFPDAPAEVRHAQANALRRAVSPEVAAKYVELTTSFDVRSFLPRVQAPTLILHSDVGGERPISASRAVASLIPDARFVATEGDSTARANYEHVADLIRRFLEEGRDQDTAIERPPTGLVTILFTDMEGSTAITQGLGDAKAQELVRAHNTIVRDALKAHGGREIKHTGDGIMASFSTASDALACAVVIQRAVAARAEGQPEVPLAVRIGLNAGEPVAEEQDLYGASVQLAKRVCDHAEPGQIVASNVVRELAAGKGFLFSDIGDVVPKGFDDAVRLYEVRWREEGSP